MAVGLGEAVRCQTQCVLSLVQWVMYLSQADESGSADDLFPFPASNYVLMCDISLSG